MEILFSPSTKQLMIAVQEWTSLASIWKELKNDSKSQTATSKASAVVLLFVPTEPAPGLGTQEDMSYGDFVTKCLEAGTDERSRFIRGDSNFTNLIDKLFDGVSVPLFDLTSGLYGINTDLQAKFDAIGDQIDGLRTKVGNVSNGVSSCASVTNLCLEDISSVKAGLKDVDEQLDALENKAGVTTESAAAFSTLVDTYSGNFETLQRGLIELTESINADAEKIFQIANSTTGLEQSVHDSCEAAAAIKPLVNDIATSVSQVVQFIADNKQQQGAVVESLSGLVDKLSSSSNGLADALRDSQAEVNNLTGKIPSSYQQMLEAALNAHEETLNWIKTNEREGHTASEVERMLNELEQKLDIVKTAMMSASEVAGLVSSLKVTLPIVDAVCKHLVGSKVDSVIKNTIDAGRLVNEVVQTKQKSEVW